MKRDTLKRWLGLGRRFGLTLVFLILVLSRLRAGTEADTTVGQIRYKMVTGKLADDCQVILLNTPRQISSSGNDWSFHIDGPYLDLVVDDGLHERLSRGYRDLEYHICIHSADHEADVVYRLDRADFNRLPCGTSLKYTVNPFRPGVIDKWEDF